jgi:lipoprotein-releasing system permease protein
MSKLELSIAWRYLRSRRGSKLLSLISLISIGGVTIAVSALIVIIGVMNGLQNDLREKILIGSPDIRVMTFGEDMVMTDWQSVLKSVKSQKGVVEVGPFVHTQALIQAKGHKYMEGVSVEGLPPDGRRGARYVDSPASPWRLLFATPDGQYRGAVPGRARRGGQRHAWHRQDQFDDRRRRSIRSPGYRIRCPRSSGDRISIPGCTITTTRTSSSRQARRRAWRNRNSGLG